MTLLALPLTAALVLHASPGEMGLLGAAEYVPFLIIGLPAGVWVDRLARARVLVVADIARCLLLAVVPLSAATGRLSLVELYAIAIGVGVGTVFFDIGYLAILPSLVARDQLLDANASLEASRSVAQVTGPALAGPLVQVLTAPAVILVDSVSYAASALLLSTLRPSPVARDRNAPRKGVVREMLAGLRAVITNPVLRALGAAVGTFNLFSNILLAVYILYVTRVLGLGPALLGLITAAGGVGAVAGTLAAGPAARRLGIGRSIIAAVLVSAVSTFGIALARGGAVAVALVLTLAQIALELGVTASVVSIVSLRQSMTPAGQEGRISATMRFIIYGSVPVGSVVGGVLGQAVGLRTTVVIAALGELLAPLWLLFSPVRTTRVTA